MLGNAGAMVQRLSGRGYRVSTDGNGAHPEIFRHQGWKPRLARGLAVQVYSALRSQRLRPPLIAPLLVTWLGNAAHCVHCRRLAPCSVLRFQLRNPGSVGALDVTKA